MTPNDPAAPDAEKSRALPDELKAREVASVRKRRESAGLAPGDPERDAVGLAISGGGIRSATFSVGVLQGLAKLGLLKRFDYLSTVSGGGYSGSFLGRMYTRPPTNPANSPNPATPPEPTAKTVETKLANPAAPEIQWLRENGRYLSPAGGTDARLALAVVLRNWVSLTWVIASFLFAVFTFGAVVRLEWWQAGFGKTVETWLAARAGAPIWWSPAIFVPLVPLLLAAVPAGWGFWFTQRGRRAWSHMPLILTLVVIVGSAGTLVVNGSEKAGGFLDTGWWWCLLALAVCGALAIVSYRLASPRLDDHALRISAARDRLSRWLSLALFATACTAGAGVVDSLGQTIYALLVTGAELPSMQPVLSWKGFSAMVAALAPLVAGGRMLVQWIVQRNGRKRVSAPTSLLAGLAAGLVVLILLVSIAVASHATLWAGGVPATDPGYTFAKRHFDRVPAVALTTEQNVKVELPGIVHVRQDPPAPVPRDAPSDLILVAFGISMAFSLLSGRTFAFLNLSSHQSLYGARLTRSYLGASNPARHGPKARRVTEVIPDDDLPFEKYHPHEHGGPLHFINVTLNETIGGDSEVLDRDRKGLPMALGPHGVSVGVRHHALWKPLDEKDRDREPVVKRRISHSVFAYPVPLRAPGFAVFPQQAEPLQLEGLRLGNWMGISGAAFSTGLGARTSVSLSLLAGVANVRLGYWFDSGIKRKAGTKDAGTEPTKAAKLLAASTALFPVQIQLLEEFLASFHGPARRRWYLTDGGHFENTACYELLRRRVPFIVCCDDGADPDYSFEDVAHLVRLARSDFGAEVEIIGGEKLADYDLDEKAKALLGARQDLVRRPPVDDETDDETKAEPEFAKHRAMLAAVRYGKDEEPKTFILFLKPTLTGEEPLDVLEYHTSHADFPQEPTSDQYFDEAQWESYRKLGEITALELFKDGEKNPPVGDADPTGMRWMPWQLRRPKSAPASTATKSKKPSH